MKAAALALLLICAPAFAAMAHFTGRQEMIQTVTFQSAWRCQYSVNGQYFWLVFPFIQGCPPTVNVQ